MRADLHLHTNASDGQYSPAELVELARQFDVIAITDHDTTDGIKEAQRTAQHYGAPIIIPGIELSAEDAEGDVHVLGYYIDIDNVDFQAELTRFRNNRYERGQRMLEKLAAMNLPLDWDRVLAIANGGAIGRPHIARAMLEAGYVESVKDAFNRYIGNDGPAYVARTRLSPEESVELIHSVGGAAVLAHPGLLKDYRALILRLIAVGLDGVEVNHPSNSENVRLDLRGIATSSNLIMTGGSDFHGPKVKPDITIGMVSPPEGAVEALKLAAARYAEH
ncbi:MAG TPA: PHP domain-containing protein [Phototrophicaceae bacterium]|nr:PHP domain-containing protein [Phototrophicaceae bacterium]